MTREITVSARAVAMALPCLGVSDIRYYLKGVIIEPHPDGGVYVVATDGVRLSVTHDLEGRADGEWVCAIPKPIAAACIRDKTPECAVLKFEGDAVSLTTSDGSKRTVEAPPIEAPPIDWKRVVPKLNSVAPRPASFAFNPKYLADFAKIAKAAGKPNASVVLYPHPDEGPALVRLDDVVDWFGVIMPVRHVATKPAILSWFNPDAPVAK